MVRADSLVGRIVLAARRGKPLLRVTASRWWASVLVAAGARPAPPSDSMVVVFRDEMDRSTPSDSPISAPDDAWIPRLESIGDYRIDRVLGSGAFASVWLGHDDSAGRSVAIKVLSGSLYDDLDVRNRFLEEARILHEAASERLVRVQNIGELPDGRPYFVMSYADRGTLAERMRKQPLSVSESLAIAEEIAYGVEDINRLGIIHRDLKPSNVLFQSTPEGGERLLIADLGLAKALAHASGAFTLPVGTPGYMSPEQARFGGGLDVRADVYGLGALSYHLLTGKAPGPPPVEIPPSRLQPELGPDVDQVIMQALEVERENRWPTAEAFARELTALRARYQRKRALQRLPFESASKVGAFRNEVAGQVDVLGQGRKRAGGRSPDAGPNLDSGLAGTVVTEDDLDDLEFHTLRTGDHAAAAERLSALAESVSGGVSRAKVLLRAGEQWQHAGDHDKAATCYRLAVEDGGESYGDPRTYLADALFELGRKDEAQALIDEIRAAAPRDPEVYRTIAEVLYEQGEAGGAYEWATLGADLVLSLQNPEERTAADDSLEALLRLRYRTRIDLGRPEDEYDTLLDDLLKP